MDEAAESSAVGPEPYKAGAVARIQLNQLDPNWAGCQEFSGKRPLRVTEKSNIFNDEVHSGQTLTEKNKFSHSS